MFRCKGQIPILGRGSASCKPGCLGLRDAYASMACVLGTSKHLICRRQPRRGSASNERNWLISSVSSNLSWVCCRRALSVPNALEYLLAAGHRSEDHAELAQSDWRSSPAGRSAGHNNICTGIQRARRPLATNRAFNSPAALEEPRCRPGEAVLEAPRARCTALHPTRHGVRAQD